MFRPEDPAFQRRTEQVNALMRSWTVIGGTGLWLEAHLLARASYAGGLPQLMGCGICEQEVEDLIADANGRVLLILSDSIAEDHGVRLMERLAERPQPPDILLLISDSTWLGRTPIEACKAGAIVDVQSFGTGAVIQALRALQAGDRFLDPRIGWRQKGTKQFTPREHEALLLLMDGATNPQIAQKMSISANTVREYLGRVFCKLGVNNRAAAAAAAARLGYGLEKNHN